MKAYTVNKFSLLEKLQKYSPTTEETVFKNEMITFVQSHRDCFERSLEIGHVTASAWLLDKDGSHALLTHHAKLDTWFQLGGHCDGNPDVLSVALKEAQEESGITKILPVSEDIFDIDIHLIPENSREKAHYHYDVRFLLQVMSDEKIIISNESKALRWINKSLHELPTKNPSVIRMFNKWIHRS